MFIFHCHRCQETFRIYFENLENKESLCCPNCGLEFPGDALKLLNLLGSSYKKAVDELKKSNTHECGWSLTIEEYNIYRPQFFEKGLLSSETDYEENHQKSYWEYDVTQESAADMFTSMKYNK